MDSLEDLAADEPYDVETDPDGPGSDLDGAVDRSPRRTNVASARPARP